MMITTIMILTVGLSSALIFMNTFICKKTNHDTEKSSAFECGFDPKSTARIPFSLRFYLIAVIFLIFDVEITLILPIPILSMSTNICSITTITLYFIAILIAGLLHEWAQGALSWTM